MRRREPELELSTVRVRERELGRETGWALGRRNESLGESGE